MLKIVPAVYYAHLASARARAHEIPSQRPKDEFATTTPEGTGAQGGSQPPPPPVPVITEDIRPLPPQMADQMWYI